MAPRLDGKTILITGAGKGIGRAVARACHAAGAAVAAIARTESDLSSLRDEVGNERLVTQAGDASDESTVERFVRLVQETLSPIRGLVNNAGVLAPKSPIVGVSTEAWDESMRVNARAPFLWIKRVLPGLIAAGDGSIVNVSSGAGKRPVPTWGAYGVSKAALEALTSLVAEETRGTGVRVNAVNPGGTRTRMRAMAYPDEDPMTLPAPDDVAPLFVWLLSDESKGVSGQSIDFAAWAAAKR